MPEKKQIRNYDVIQISDQLNDLLANYQLHYQKLRNFHWTVFGDHFFELHRKFEELYNLFQTQIDDIAERILVLGTRPLGTLHAYLTESQIREVINPITAEEMVAEISQDYNVLLPKMRQIIDTAAESGDEGTVDMISDFLRKIEKQQWMLQMFLKKEEDRVKLS